MSEHGLSPSSSQTNANKDDSGMSFARYALIAAGGLIGLIVLVFLGGVGLAVFTDPQQTAPRIGLLRDVFIIILSLQFILIIIALAALILQIARLVGLLSTEVKPILKDTQETLETAKGTAQFVGKNVAGPLIKLKAFLAGFGVLLREMWGIRRAVRRTRKEGNNEE